MAVRRSVGVGLFAVLAGCGSDPGAERERPQTVDTAPSGPMQPGIMEHRNTTVVDVDTLPNRWEAAPGWFFTTATVLGDLDGDGYEEIAVGAAEEGTSNGGWLVVQGPVRRPMTLPGDEYLMLVNPGNILSSDDLDGDGVRDLAFQISNRTHVVLGPFAGGTLDVAATATDLGVLAEIRDINGDGVLDYVTSDWYDSASVTFGPLARFGTVPPDIVVDPDCGESWAGLDAVPDIDGDGVRELRVAEMLWDCPSWIMPLQTGLVVPEDVGAHSAPAFEVIADQSGDGAPDVWWPGGSQVLASPVTFDSEGNLGSADVVTAPDYLDTIYVIPADLTGDGLGDFIVYGDDRGETLEENWVGGVRPEFESWMMVLAGGAALAAGTDTGTVFDMGGGVGALTGVAAVEDGTVYSLVRQGPPDQDVPSVLIVVDLGPGAAVPAP